MATSSPRDRSQSPPATAISRVGRGREAARCSPVRSPPRPPPWPGASPIRASWGIDHGTRPQGRVAHRRAPGARHRYRLDHPRALPQDDGHQGAGPGAFRRLAPRRRGTRPAGIPARRRARDRSAHPGRRKQLRLRVFARARAVGARRRRIPRGGQLVDRRHLPRQRGQERPGARGGPDRPARGDAVGAVLLRHRRSRVDDRRPRKRKDGQLLARPVRAALPDEWTGRARLPPRATAAHRGVGGGMRALIALLPGDGIGPEVVDEGARLLRAVGTLSRHEFQLEKGIIGGAAIDATGTPLPDSTLALCPRADAGLLGAVCGPQWAPSAPVRPGQGLLAPRKELGLFANLRPVTVHPRVASASPVKAELLADVDFVVVRELTGGIYFGEKTRTADSASDLCSYTADEVRRVVRVAARLAQKRRRRLTSVDKANVLETSRLWRGVTSPVGPDAVPHLPLAHVPGDACAMLLVQRPSRFDVVVTENMFGDILTDEAAVLSGSIGLLPSPSPG